MSFQESDPCVCANIFFSGSLRRNFIFLQFNKNKTNTKTNKKCNACTFFQISNLMNDLPGIGSLCLRKYLFGITRGKYCKLVKGNIWRKVISTSEKKESSMLFRRSFIINGLGQCWYDGSVSFHLNNQEICYEIYRWFLVLREVYC